MVLLVPAPPLLAAIAAYNALPTTTGAPLAASPPSLHHRQVYAVSCALLARHPNTAAYTLPALLRGTQIYHPPPPPPPAKTPEYIALMARLRAQQEEAEYQRLISPPSTYSAGPLTREEEEEELTWKEVKGQVSVIVNILLSTVATAAAVWMVAGAWEAPQRLAVAFAAAIVVAVAEVVLFGGYMRRLEEAKERAKKEGETKEATGVRWIVASDGVREEKGVVASDGVGEEKGIVDGKLE